MNHAHVADADYIETADLSRALNVTPNEVRRLVHRGVIQPAARTPRGNLFTVEERDRVVAERRERLGR